jgi:hypothetical protein
MYPFVRCRAAARCAPSREATQRSRRIPLADAAEAPPRSHPWRSRRLRRWSLLLVRGASDPFDVRVHDDEQPGDGSRCPSRRKHSRPSVQAKSLQTGISGLTIWDQPPKARSSRAKHARRGGYQQAGGGTPGAGRSHPNTLCSWSALARLGEEPRRSCSRRGRSGDPHLDVRVGRLLGFRTRGKRAHDRLRPPTPAPHALDVGGPKPLVI